MKRRDFIKTLGIAAASTALPSNWSLKSMYRQANAAVNYAAASVTPPAVMPQIINVFLYGGPSELAGNLTNIVEINQRSQNLYDAAAAQRPPFLGITLSDTLFVPDTAPAQKGLITPRGFWSTAGGNDMEFLINKKHMSVYRTMMKRIDPSSSHRESILTAQKGSLNIEDSPGMAARLAAILLQHRTQYEGSTKLADNTLITNIENDLATLPFVSFEGQTRIFTPDNDFALPVNFRGVTLDTDLSNPFRKSWDVNVALFKNLLDSTLTPQQKIAYSKAIEAENIREMLKDQVAFIEPPFLQNQVLPTLTDAADITANGGSQLAYPANNEFSARVRAAVTLAIENPSTVFTSVGGPLGGFDDHNDGEDYPVKMNDLFATLRTAMLHIKYRNNTVALRTGKTRVTNNIVINVYGDFGRLINLNDSGGWDHGNNQILYTFGGAGVRPLGAAALGKVVGTTKVVGTAGTNSQVLEPDTGSYEAEPIAIAASMYSYFGVQNPEVITADDVKAPNGIPAIDESTPGV